MTQVLRWTDEQLRAYERKHRLAVNTIKSGASVSLGATQTAQERTAPAQATTAPADRWPLVLRDQIVAAGLPEPLREACFHPTRGWRSDLSWPDRKLAVEIEGGAHGARKIRERDCEKHNAYMLLGWRYLRVLPRMVETGQALHHVRELLT